jgi:hypothetical protein
MRVIAFMTLALLLAGCASDRRSQSLTATLNAYANTLRWGDFQSAAQFVDPQVLAEHPPSALELARYQQLRVSDYDDGAGPVPDGENQVRQTVQINLINVHTQTERSVIDHQTWRYDAAKNHWWLTSGLPNVTR